MGNGYREIVEDVCSRVIGKFPDELRWDGINKRGVQYGKPVHFEDGETVYVLSGAEIGTLCTDSQSLRHQLGQERQKTAEAVDYASHASEQNKRLAEENQRLSREVEYLRAELELARQGEPVAAD